MSRRVCVFEGEGAVPEAMTPTVELLRQLNLDIEFEFPTVPESTPGAVPTSIKRRIDDADAVLFGAAAGDGGTYIKILTYLRTQYGGGLPANVRPIRHFTGASSPLSGAADVDYVVVRENPPSPFSRTENIEGALRDIAQISSDFDGDGVLGKDFRALGDGAFQLQVFPERNTRYLASVTAAFADEWFDHRPISVTSATKSNVLTGTHGLFDSLVEEAVAEYDSLEYEHLQVDNVGNLLVSEPERFDVVIAPNAEGDILSDIGAATAGGLGLAPSGCYGANAAYFEPIHGTAPDIEGEGIINPTATILSAEMMLRYLNFDDAADRLEGAVSAVYESGTALTPDQGGSATTEEMANAIGLCL